MNRPVAPARARRTAAAFVAVSVLALAGCTSDASEPQAAGDAKPAGATKSSTPEPSATITTNLQDVRGPVAVDEVVEVSAEDGSLERVVVRAGSERVAGELSADGSSWTATDRLEPGLRYNVQAVAVDDEGKILITDTGNQRVQVFARP